MRILDKCTDTTCNNTQQRETTTNKRPKNIQIYKLLIFNAQLVFYTLANNALNSEKKGMKRDFMPLHNTELKCFLLKSPRFCKIPAINICQL